MTKDKRRELEALQLIEQTKHAGTVWSPIMGLDGLTWPDAVIEPMTLEAARTHLNSLGMTLGLVFREVDGSVRKNPINGR